MKLRLQELATELAKKGSGRFKLGAVVAQKGRPVAVGYNNMEKTDPKSPHQYRCQHAESHAIIGTPAHLLDGAQIYVARILKSGRLGMARPCPYCQRLIEESGIKRVYYSTEEGWVEL